MWVNANALAAYGLNRYGYRTLALEIAHRVTAALADDLRAAGTWHEAYSTEDGKPLAAKGFLSWDTLSAELVDNLLAGRDPLSLDKPNLFAERDPLNIIASWSPIRELSVVIGKSGAPCPTGTSRIGAGAGWDSDFNDGAGGDYVYLCMSTKGAKPPITGLLAVHANTTSGAVCPTNYTKLAGNMQSKSRSKGVAFLCVSRSNVTDGKQPLGVLQGVLASSGCGAMHAVNDSRAVSTPFKFDAAGVGVLLCAAPIPPPCPPAPPPSSDPITSVMAVVSKLEGACCPKGYSRVLNASSAWDADLNDGAKGSFVYLCASREVKSDPITRLVAFTTPSAAQPFGDCPPNTTKVKGVGGDDWTHNDLNFGSMNPGAMYLCHGSQAGQPPIRDVVGVAGEINSTACPDGSRFVEGAASQGGKGKPFDFDPRGIGVRLCAS